MDYSLVPKSVTFKNQESDNLWKLVIFWEKYYSGINKEYFLYNYYTNEKIKIHSAITCVVFKGTHLPLDEHGCLKLYVKIFDESEGTNWILFFTTSEDIKAITRQEIRVNWKIYDDKYDVDFSTDGETSPESNNEEPVVNIVAEEVEKNFDQEQEFEDKIKSIVDVKKKLDVSKEELKILNDKLQMAEKALREKDTQFEKIHRDYQRYLYDLRREFDYNESARPEQQDEISREVFYRIRWILKHNSFLKKLFGFLCWLFANFISLLSFLFAKLGELLSLLTKHFWRFTLKHLNYNTEKDDIPEIAEPNDDYKTIGEPTKEVMLPSVEIGIIGSRLRMTVRYETAEATCSFVLNNSLFPVKLFRGVAFVWQDEVDFQQLARYPKWKLLVEQDEVNKRFIVNNRNESVDYFSQKKINLDVQNATAEEWVSTLEPCEEHPTLLGNFLNSLKHGESLRKQNLAFKQIEQKLDGFENICNSLQIVSSETVRQGAGLKDYFISLHLDDVDSRLVHLDIDFKKEPDLCLESDKVKIIISEEQKLIDLDDQVNITFDFNPYARGNPGPYPIEIFFIADHVAVQTFLLFIIPDSDAPYALKQASYLILKPVTGWTFNGVQKEAAERTGTVANEIKADTTKAVPSLQPQSIKLFAPSDDENKWKLLIKWPDILSDISDLSIDIYGFEPIALKSAITLVRFEYEKLPLDADGKFDVKGRLLLAEHETWMLHFSTHEAITQLAKDGEQKDEAKLVYDVACKFQKEIWDSETKDKMQRTIDV